MPTYRKRSESTLVTEVMRYLMVLENAGKIAFWNRQQCGSVNVEIPWRKSPIPYGSKKRRIRLGRSGVADLWVIPSRNVNYVRPAMIWVECKTETGKQSTEQKEFQQIVEQTFHKYWIVRSVDELDKKFKADIWDFNTNIFPPIIVK